jgi:hypothetical protein
MALNRSPEHMVYIDISLLGPSYEVSSISLLGPSYEVSSKSAKYLLEIFKSYILIYQAHRQPSFSADCYS